MSKSISDDTISYGSTYSLSSQSQLSTQGSEFYREGYKISSWNTEPDGSGDIYLSNAIITVTESLDLYAMWQLI